MNTQPFVLVGNSRLERIGAALQARIANWQSAWGIERMPVSIACERAWEADGAAALRWQRRFVAEGQGFWMAWNPDLAMHLGRHIFSDGYRAQGGPGSMSSEGSALALDFLTEQLRAALAPASISADASAQEIDAGLFKRGSGAVLALINLDGQTVGCLLEHASAEALATTQPAALPRLAAVDLPKAARHAHVSVALTVGQAQVGAASLLALAVGDVIRLDAPVDQPLAVHGTEGQLLFGACLGRQGSAKVFEAVRLPG
jgi:hypothetical protein